MQTGRKKELPKRSRYYQSVADVSTTPEGSYQDTTLTIHGRHDVCLCPRIVPVVEAMTWLTLADMYLQAKR